MQRSRSKDEKFFLGIARNQLQVAFSPPWQPYPLITSRSMPEIVPRLCAVNWSRQLDDYLIVFGFVRFLHRSPHCHLSLISIVCIRVYILRMHTTRYRFLNDFPLPLLLLTLTFQNFRLIVIPLSRIIQFFDYYRVFFTVQINSSISVH